MERRVVITGLGVVSPVGTGVEKFWNSLLEGKSGIAPITRFDAADFPVKIAGEVKDFDPALAGARRAAGARSTRSRPAVTKFAITR